MKEDKVILGIDPGTQILGYGLVNSIQGKLALVHYGAIKLTSYATPELKLKKILERVQHLIEHYKPDEIAIEAPFFGKNIQSMLKLGRVQGLVMAIALQKEIPIVEYAPKKIKQSVSGSGNASKEQVAYMLSTILKFPQDATQVFDATDGLAVAVCHCFHGKNIQSTNKGTKKGWAAFVNENPNRIS